MEENRRVYLSDQDMTRLRKLVDERPGSQKIKILEILYQPEAAGHWDL